MPAWVRHRVTAWGDQRGGDVHTHLLLVVYLGHGHTGEQEPGTRSVLVAIRDLDPKRLCFRKLRDRYFKHAVLVRGLDCVATYIARKPEGPMDSAVVAFCTVNSRVLSQRRRIGRSRHGAERHPGVISCLVSRAGRGRSAESGFSIPPWLRKFGRNVWHFSHGEQLRLWPSAAARMETSPCPKRSPLPRPLGKAAQLRENFVAPTALIRFLFTRPINVIESGRPAAAPAARTTPLAVVKPAARRA